MANGNFGGGSGTEASPYLIEDYEDFRAIDNYAGNNEVFFKQANDLDFNGIDFTPISMETPYFRGSYDGNNKKILNVNIATELRHNALFGVTYGSFKNLKLENITSTTTIGEYCSPFIAFLGSGKIENCEAINISVESTGTNVGGLVGYLSGGLIKNSKVQGSKVISIGAYVGGLVGLQVGAASVIENCIVDLDEVGASNTCGGLLGWNISGIVKNNVVIVNKIIKKSTSSSSNKFGDIGGNVPSTALQGENISNDDMQFIN